MSKSRIFAIAVATLALAVPAVAGVPPMINYQGKLMQPSGVPVPDGTYQMRFAIYSVPTGGTPLWSETNPNVQVKGGLFSVLLGSVNNLPANIFDSPDRWFGVTVGTDPEMTPRQRIVSVAYAVSAGTVLDGAVTTSKLADGAVTARKIANGAITMEKLAPGAVAAGSIAAGAITAVSLADGAVTAAKIADGSVTLPKMADEGWKDYTPAWTTWASPQPNIGNGQLTGKYLRLGKTVFCRIGFNPGSTTSFGTGEWMFSLPLPATTFFSGTVGGDHAGSHRVTGVALTRSPTFTNVSIQSHGSTTGYWSASNPFVWGSGDWFTLSIVYECQ